MSSETGLTGTEGGESKLKVKLGNANIRGEKGRVARETGEKPRESCVTEGKRKTFQKGGVNIISCKERKISPGKTYVLLC